MRDKILKKLSRKVDQDLEVSKVSVYELEQQLDSLTEVGPAKDVVPRNWRGLDLFLVG